jgi:hypothetical protein
MNNVTSEGEASTEVQKLIDQQRANVDELKKLRSKLSFVQDRSELAVNLR